MRYFLARGVFFGLVNGLMVTYLLIPIFGGGHGILPTFEPETPMEEDQSASTGDTSDSRAAARPTRRLCAMAVSSSRIIKKVIGEFRPGAHPPSFLPP